MSKIFYYGLDNKVHGPYDEQQAQKWYFEGYFSSDTQFQISLSEHFDQRERIYTLGELINHNSRMLPFYFSADLRKEKRDEDLLNTLLQEVESLRVSCNEKTASDRAEDRDTIDALRSQLVVLVESHSDLRARLDTLTNQKENGSGVKEMEKKVNELKRRVDEQEKNQTAMKKEISAVTSKCDRNDTKLSALLEKQKTAESMTDGFDKRISDLKDSEKSIRDTLKNCEESTATSNTQLESIKKDLGKIRTEMESDRKVSSTGRSELETVKKGLSEVQGVMKRGREHSQQLQQPAPVVDEEMEPWATATTPAASKAASPDSPDLPPWEITAKTVKKSDSAPWDLSEPQDEAEPEPWAMNGTSHKESVQATKKEVKGVTIEQKAKNGTVQAAVGTVRNGVQPISGKNWDAICRELSDDEEEKEENPLRKHAAASDLEIPIVKTSNEVEGVICVVIKILRLYVSALSERNLDNLKGIDSKEHLGTGAVALTWKLDSREFMALAAALKTEMPKLTHNGMAVCWECIFHVLTPLNMLDHFNDPKHVEVMCALKYPVLEVAAKYVSEVLGRFSMLLKRTTPGVRDTPLFEKGAAILARHLDPSEYRPTTAFANSLWLAEMTKMCDANTTEFEVDFNEPWKNIFALGIQQKWFSEEANKRRFLGELEAHIATGVAYCPTCNLAYESIGDFYKHMTSYSHAYRGPCALYIAIRLCRGTEDWDIHE